MGVNVSKSQYSYHDESKLIVFGFCHRYYAELPLDIIEICNTFYGVSIIDIIQLNDDKNQKNGKYNMEALIYKLFVSSNSKKHYSEYIRCRATLWKIIFLEQYIDPYPIYHIDKQQYINKLSSCKQHSGIKSDTTRWLALFATKQLPLNKELVERIHNMFTDNYSKTEQSYYQNGSVYLTFILSNILKDEYITYLCLSSLLLRIYPTYNIHHSNNIMKMLRDKYNDRVPSSSGGLYCAFVLITETLKIFDSKLQNIMDKVGVSPLMYVYRLKYFLYNTFNDCLIVWDFILLNGIGYIIIIVIVLLINKHNGVRQRLKSKNKKLTDIQIGELMEILTQIFSDSCNDFKFYIPYIYKVANEIKRKYSKLWYEIMNHAVDMDLISDILPRIICSHMRYGD